MFDLSFQKVDKNETYPLRSNKNGEYTNEGTDNKVPVPKG
nr:MAG TPA: hypothetical protein [Caudoviricetes sp.]